MRNHTFYHYIYWKIEKVFQIMPPPPPLDTGIPDKYDLIFIKEVDTTNGVLYLSRRGCHTRCFGTLWRGGGEGDKILNCYTFDLFTLSIDIH